MNSIARHFGSIKDINFKNEILAGLTVAMTMIPESLSFAILAGFPPLVGLYGAFIMGFVTSIFGGRPGLISGGAGATVIVLMGLMEHCFTFFRYVYCSTENMLATMSHT